MHDIVLQLHLDRLTNRDADVAHALIGVLDLEFPYSGADFVARAIEVMGQTRPAGVAIDISSTGAVLASVDASFPLVVVHRDEVDPDVCQVGQVIRVDDTMVTLREVDSEGEWRDEEDEYDLDEITRVDFGGVYDTSLARVAGL